MEQFKKYFFDYFVDTIKNHYVDFNGKANLAQFWYFTLFSFVVGVAVGIVASATVLALSGIYSLAILLPSLGIAVRRMHDINRSGLWVLVVLVPIAGIIYFIYLAVQPSK